MQPKGKLWTITAHEGEKSHTLRVIAPDLLSAVQKAETQFIRKDPKDLRGEIVRAEFSGDMHILS